MTVSNISPKATVPIVTKSHLEPPGIMFKPYRSHDQLWPPHPYMVKFFKNLQLQNQLIDGLATLYEALGALVIPRLFK